MPAFAVQANDSDRFLDHQRRDAGHARSAKAGGPSVKRFDLSGYVIATDYSLGRNTGNTFRQTDKHSTVQGVSIAGPFVGTKFPAEDCVAMPIGNHELYVAWLDPKKHALVDVFVMTSRPTWCSTTRPAAPTPRARGRSPSSTRARTRFRSGRDATPQPAGNLPSRREPAL